MKIINKVVKGIKDPRRAMRVIKKLSLEQIRKRCIIPWYKKKVLAAFENTDSKEHNEFRKIYRRVYGIERVQDWKRYEIHRILMYESAHTLYKEAYKKDLGAFEIGFEDILFNCHSYDQLGSSIYLTGFYEEIAAIDQIRKFIRPGSCAVDVGANVGIFSLILSRCVGPTGKVIAYEPKESLVRDMEANLELNKVKNVDIRICCVGEKNGSVPFEEELGNFNKGVAYVNLNSKKIFPMVSLDENFKGREEDISIIKIDVEGYELNVIKGAQRILRKARPFIFLEHNTPVWSNKDMIEAFPWEIEVWRLPNNYYENVTIVKDWDSLKGFNNILIMPKSS